MVLCDVPRVVEVVGGYAATLCPSGLRGGLKFRYCELRGFKSHRCQVLEGNGEARHGDDGGGFK